MQITQEQERAMFDGATRASNTREMALRDAMDTMRTACEDCWFRQNGECEQKHCSIWRMSQTWVQVMRMRRAGKLDSWNYYTEAKNNNRLLFINPKKED